MYPLNRMIFFIALVVSLTTHAQKSTLRAYMDTKQFYAPTIGNYVEVYFQFVAYSIKFKGAEGGLQAELVVSFQLKNERDSIVSQDAYRLQSPLMKDSVVDDFYDVKRIPVSAGKYTLAIEILDINSDQPAVKASQPIVVDEFKNAITASGIETIEYAKPMGDETSLFFKSGYTIIPRLSLNFSKELNYLPVYLEFYNTHKLPDSLCTIKQFVTNTETGQELTDLTQFIPQRTAEVVPVLKNMDISKVPTGKYALNYTLLSRDMKELVTTRIVFERSNDMELTVDVDKLVLDPAFQGSITDDSVGYYLESLIPIARPQEIKNIISILKTKDKQKQRLHIQAFWLTTAPGHVYDAWIKYKAQVQLVEKVYSTNFQEGFETDRGRVYLQYGSPTNIIVRETSPSEYPYEIWQYNKISNFSNRRFIFYNPDLVNNAYRLLHSDMLGELKNPGWSQVLSRRNTTTGTVEDPNKNVQDSFGNSSHDLFRQY
jgi:GWxTD domain-containing protein